MKKEWEIDRDTGMLGAYEEENAILRKTEDGRVETIFRDTRHWITPEGLVRERLMLIGGKSFRVTSVLPNSGKATPTEKLISYIDRELEEEAPSI